MQAVPIAFTLGLLLLASAARAQAPDPEPLRLTYRGAATCPDVMTFKDIVSASLAGKDPFVEEAPHRLEVGVRRLGPAHFVADAVLSDDAGEVLYRTEQTAPTCGQALRLVAVMVASWWRPLVVGQPAVVEVAAPPKVEAAAAAPVCPTPTPAPRLEAEAVWPLPAVRLVEAPPVETKVPLEFRVGAEVWAEWITADRSSLGLTLDASIRYGRVSVMVEGHVAPPLGGVPLSTGATLNYTLASGALFLCGHIDPLILCAKGEAGQLLLSGRVIPDALMYGAVGLRAGLEYRVAPSRFSLRLLADMLATIDPGQAKDQEGSGIQVLGYRAGIGLGALFALERL